MALLRRRVEPPPFPIQPVHEDVPVARNRDFAATTLEGGRKVDVLAFVHFKAVRHAVAARVVQVWRIAIEQGIGAVVKADDVDRWAVLDLHAKKPRGDFGERVDATEPARDDAGHPRPARVLAVCPPPESRGLGQPGARLARTYVKPSCAFKVGCGFRYPDDGTVKL